MSKSITFADFRSRYLDEAVQFMSENTQAKIEGLFRLLENRGLRLLSNMDSQWISRWAAWRRECGVRDATIHGNLLYIQAMLNWAHDQRLIAEVPHIKFPARVKRQKVMKGRPITQEEFERMKSCCKDDHMRVFLDGLWLSGLRLQEALDLSWQEEPDCMSVDFSGEYPMFKVPASAEKGNQERILPMAPEFAQMLQDVPELLMTGKCFNGLSGCVSEAITALGEAAGVVVDAKSGKFASAHDLRRSFGERWARRVMPAVLMQLMRHESVETTMRFYVGQNANAVARQCWDSMKIGAANNG